MRVTKVWIAPAALQTIMRAAGTRVAGEPCGVLLGYRVPLGAEVLEAGAVRNSHASPDRAFLMLPESILEVGRAGRARGLDVVGFWHGHLDGPAWPGELDEEGMQGLRIEGAPPMVHLVAGRGTAGKTVVRAFHDGGQRARNVPLTLLRRARGRSAAASH